MARQVALIEQIKQWVEEYETIDESKERELFFKIMNAVRSLR